MRPFLRQFRRKLKKLLGDRGWSGVTYAKQIGKDPSTVSRILSGSMGLVPEEWPAWTAPFAFAGTEAEEFRQGMALAAMAEPAQEIVWALMDQLDALEARVEKVESSAAMVRSALDLITAKELSMRPKLLGRSEPLLFRRVTCDQPGVNDEDSASDL